MRLRAAALLVVVLSTVSAFAQEFRLQGVDVFGGYSYASIDTNGLTRWRQSANGWEASLSVNLHKYFAAEVDGSGYYKDNLLGSGLNGSDYGFAGGPRFNYRGLFFHSLFGVDHLTGSAGGFSDSQNGFALIEGGGVQVPIARRWAVRGSVDWVLTHHNVVGSTEVDQNNVRVSAGLVYTFRRGDHGVPAAGAGAVAVVRGTRVPQLGVTVQETGELRIVGVDTDGPAARSGLKDGDVLLAIDGRTVHTAQEVNAALAANTNRTVRVECLLQGTWTVEVKVDLGGAR